MVYLTHDEKVDEQEVIVVRDQKVDLPLYHVLTQAHQSQQVFSFRPPAQASGTHYLSCLLLFCTLLRGAQLVRTY